MKFKTSELTGAALDCTVALCEGYSDVRVNPHPWDKGLVMTPPREAYGPVYLSDLCYSGDWGLGGPIIEKAGITVSLRYGSLPPNHVQDTWDASIQPEYYTTGRPGSGVMKAVTVTGPTPLIAAMRCYVASRLGDEVEIPEELA